MLRYSIFTILIILTSLSASIDANAQKQRIRSLNIGDTIPDIHLEMINYKSGTARISDFKGKLLILDFWSTWCGSCIALFPHMEKLQRHFGDKIMILPVTGYKTKEYNEAFFEEREKMGREIKLPSIVEDTMLNKLFPTYGLPHEVWINRSGVVIAITDQFPVTKEVINKVLDGKNINLPVQIYDKSFNQWKPLLVNNNGGPDSDFIYRSILTHYNPNVNSIGSIHFTDSSFTRLVVTNMPILYLYKLAFSNNFNDYFGKPDRDNLNKRVIIESKDSSLLKSWNDVNLSDYNAIELFKHKFLYCYEILLPTSFSINDAYAMMCQDISRFFKLNVSIEKRTINCLALISNSNNRKFISTSTNLIFDSDSPAHFKINGFSIDKLIQYLNNNFKIPYVVNRTGYNGNVHFAMNITNVNNIDTLCNALQKYNLDLINVKLKLDMLVFK